MHLVDLSLVGIWIVFRITETAGRSKKSAFAVAVGNLGKPKSAI